MASRDYRILMPPDVTVVAACKDVGCDAWAYGWESFIDESTPLGAAQARYIRTQSGRTFREQRNEFGVTVFRFEPHQRCFAEHRTRPGRLLVTSGRALIREHANLRDLAEDYTEHVGHLADQQQKG